MPDGENKGEPLEYRYANYFAVGHGSGEVVLKFGQAYEGSEPHIHTGVVTTPKGAMDLLQLLQESVDQNPETFRGGRGGTHE